jgi:signal transduction histidine kinase
MGPDQTTLEIRDDGRGFEAQDRLIDLARQGHLGLVGMSERTKAIGGQLQLISTPGKGTIVRVIVPHMD